jgi:protein-disulfide isomerase
MGASLRYADRMIVRPLSAAALLLALASAGCKPSADPATAKPVAAAGPQAVVAEVDGQPITAEELDRHAAGELQRVRDQEYEARKNALEDLIHQRLIKKAATGRGVSEDELMRVEVGDKVKPPSPAEIQEIYDANRDRVGGRTRAEVEPQIISSVVQQRTAERARAFVQGLRDQAKVKIVLEQPRSEVTIPPGMAVLGPADAKVTIVEFSDYLCPYCQSAEAVVSKVLERYKGKVKFIHRDLLLGRPRSLPVARGALCAGEQGKFWEYRHDLLSNVGDWSDQDLEARAARMGLRAADFKSCLASDRLDKTVLASTEEGQRLGVTGTPTFFVNGRRMTGARSEQQFDEIIQAELR